MKNDTNKKSKIINNKNIIIKNDDYNNNIIFYSFVKTENVVNNISIIMNE